MAEEQSAIEVVTQTEYIYEDTQCVSGVEPEYKWDEIYRLISRRDVRHGSRRGAHLCQHREIRHHEGGYQTRAVPML